MFEKLRDKIDSDKPDDYHGTELLAQGSSYVNIHGARTPEESAHLREAIMTVLDECYLDIAEMSADKSE